MPDDAGREARPREKRAGESERRLTRLRLWVHFASLLVAVRTHAPTAGQPKAAPGSAPVPAPAPGVSRIRVPITLSLGALFAEAEARIPLEVSSGDGWVPLPGGPSWVRVRYTIRRGPLNLRLNGTAIEATTEIAYSVQAKRVAFPPVSVGLGTGSDPPRRARLSLRVDLEVTPWWGLRAVSRVQVEPIDRCNVTFLKLDVTEMIRHAAQKELSRLVVEQIDRPINETRLLRDEAARAWARLQAPLPLPEGLWLHVRPERLGVSDLAGEDHTLRLNAHLVCAPEVTGGGLLAAQASPLPDMAVFPSGEGEGFRVALDGTVPFEDAGRLVFRGLAADPDTGKPRVFRASGFTFRPTGAKVEGDGDHLRLTIPFAGSATGKLVLTGRPRYDTATQCLCADGVSYTIETRNLLARLGLAMFRESVRKAIARAARWPVQGSLGLARERLDAALNRPLGDGVRLSGRTRAITPLQVEIRGEALYARVLVEGDAALVVTPELPPLSGGPLRLPDPGPKLL